MGAGFLQVLLAGVLAVAMGEEYWQKYFFFTFLCSVTVLGCTQEYQSLDTGLIILLNKYALQWIKKKTIKQAWADMCQVQ